MKIETIMMVDYKQTKEKIKDITSEVGKGQKRYFYHTLKYHYKNVCITYHYFHNRKTTGDGIQQ